VASRVVSSRHLTEHPGGGVHEVLHGAIVFAPVNAARAASTSLERFRGPGGVS
jgi:hypothetical protein